MAFAWYVIRSKPHREDFLARELESREVEVFHPRLRANPVNPRARRFKSYFPGYLFVHVDLDKIPNTVIEHIPGAVNLVSFGGEIPAVPDNILQAIRRKVEEVNAAGGEKQVTLQPGDLVDIEQGPFAGYTAILDANLPGSERVRVLLGMLQKRELPVEMPAAYVKTSRSSRKPR